MIDKRSHVLGVIMAVMLFGVTTYAAGVMMVKSDRPIVPKPNQALIVFMRLQSSAAKALWYDDYNQSVSIFDVSGNDTKLLGILKGGNKISYDVVPGEYTIMVISEAADFMKTTVSAGKTYYALVTPRMGGMKARFSFQPLRQSDLASAKFSKWDSNTDLVDNTPESEEWAKRNAADIEMKRARYWPVWCMKPLDQRETQTLKSEDGR